jgi:hypothetical protein
VAVSFIGGGNWSTRINPPTFSYLQNIRLTQTSLRSINKQVSCSCRISIDWCLTPSISSISAISWHCRIWKILINGWGRREFESHSGAVYSIRWENSLALSSSNWNKNRYYLFITLIFCVSQIRWENYLALSYSNWNKNRYYLYFSWRTTITSSFLTLCGRHRRYEL